MRHRIWFALVLVVAAGCSFFPVDLKDLSRDAPIRQRYLFDVPLPEVSQDAGKSTAVLLLEQARAASPFNGRPFVYRTGSAEHTADYYHEFLTAPAEQISQITHSWLRTTRQFAHVIDSDSPLLASHLLAIELTDLRGDYRVAEHAVATLALRIVLTNVATDTQTAQVLLEKDYRAELAIPDATASALVAGWSAGIAQILGELSTDLRPYGGAR
jgi:hypothetical protein